MAMLILNSVFARTWGARSGPQPATEYWEDVIPAIRKQHPHFLFVAEAYWDMEWDLQQKGFDFCYDKRLYDRLRGDSAESIRLHLGAGLSYQDKLLRFIENHDEPRAAASFSSEKLRAVTLATATLPGMKLFHEGQFEGRKVRVPVFLGRRADEPVDEILQTFSRKLLQLIHRPLFRDGEWQLCTQTGWADNTSSQNIAAWCLRKMEDRVLIAINLSAQPSQANIQLPWTGLAGKTWQLNDAFSGTADTHDGHQLVSPGLYVELQPWAFHLIELARANSSESNPSAP